LREFVSGLLSRAELRLCDRFSLNDHAPTRSDQTTTRLKREKDVKTKVPRAVPVHPALAKLLADWRQWGWKKMVGVDHEPRPDDLIVPSRRGNN
jgi:hypothetical protein